MTSLHHGLSLPLLFGVLVVMAGTLGRQLVDGGQVGQAGGTPGMLLWILSPALLAWAFSRWDPRTRHARGLSLRQSLPAALRSGLGAGVAMLTLILSGLAAGALTLPQGAPLWAKLLPLALTVCLFAALEEAAWRGYLMPSLMLRTDYARVLVLGALIWCAWHLPYLDVLLRAYTAEPWLTLAPRLALGFLAMQFLYMELYLRWPSMWPAFALHAGMNLCAQSALVQGLRLSGEWAWVFSPSADGLLVILACASAGGLLRRSRLSGKTAGVTARR